MNMTLKPTRTDDNSFQQLVKDLLEAFPQPIDIDYFKYSGVEQTDVFMNETQISRFERFAAFTRILYSSGIIVADSFNESSIDYFCDVRLTVDAYEAFRSHFKDRNLDDTADIMTVIAAIHKSNARYTRFSRATLNAPIPEAIPRKVSQENALPLTTPL